MCLYSEHMNVTPLNRHSAQTLRERVAEEVRAELGRAGISVNAAAKALDWSQPYLQRRVSGKTAFDVDDLETLSKWLQVPVEQLLYGPASVSQAVSRRYHGTNHGTVLSFPQARISRPRYLTRPARVITLGRPRRNGTEPSLSDTSPGAVTPVTAVVGS